MNEAKYLENKPKAAPKYPKLIENSPKIASLVSLEIPIGTPGALGSLGTQLGYQDKQETAIC